MSDPTIADNLFLSDLSPKDKPWDSHRANTDQVSHLYDLANHGNYALKTASCSRWLEFALRQVPDKPETVFKLTRALFCRVRHCPICQWRRSLKWKSKIIQAMPKITSAYPKHRWLFLTLTIRNCELSDLRETLGAMNRAFKRLTVLQAYPAVGWIKAVEVTRNSETNQAHPHFHCLLLVPPSYFGQGYLSQAKWVALWRQCLRLDYDPLVDVKAVKATAVSDGSQSMSSAMAGAICEVLKYSVKPSDLIADPAWLSELTKQLHKTKAVAIGGVLREFLREESDKDDLINLDEEIEEVEILESENDPLFTFGWRETVKRYTLKE